MSTQLTMITAYQTVLRQLWTMRNQRTPAPEGWYERERRDYLRRVQWWRANGARF